MPTKNRRVATYLPREIDSRFTAFKIDRGIEGDSQALIVILSEFLGVSQNATQMVAHCSELVDVNQFEELLVRVETLEKEQQSAKASESNSELLSELLSKLQELERKVTQMESSRDKDSTLTTGELAKRLGIDSSTLSHWKSGKKSKSPDELLHATRDKDPDGIGWVFLSEVNRFKPERELLSESSSVLQGELLKTEKV